MKLPTKFFISIAFTLAILLAACSGLATPATGGTPAPTSGAAGSVPLAGGTPTLIGGAGSPTTVPATVAATSSSSQSTSAPTAAATSPQATSAATSAVPSAPISAATTAATAPATGQTTSTPAAASPTAPASAGATAVIPVTGASPTPGPSEACTNAYFPLSAAASWTYASSGGALGDFNDVRTLSNFSDTGFTTQDAITPGDLTLPVKWNCSGGNLTPLAAGLGNGTISVAGLTLQVASANASGFAIPADFTSGSQWAESLRMLGSMLRNGVNNGSAQATAQINCSAGGSESITVPAGTFDAVKVTCHTEVTVNSTATTLNNNAITLNGDETSWYAKGVGLIKSIKTGVGGTQTITLMKYSLQ